MNKPNKNKDVDTETRAVVTRGERREQNGLRGVNHTVIAAS